MFTGLRLFQVAVLPVALLANACGGRLAVERDADAGEPAVAVDASAPPLDGNDAPPAMDANEADAAADSDGWFADAGLVDVAVNDVATDADEGEASAEASTGQDATVVDADVEAGPPAALTFVLYDEDLVLPGQPRKGLAADNLERVYLSDGDTVYVITGTTVDTYMTKEDVSEITGVPSEILSLDDVSSSLAGDLFILTGSVLGRTIITSTTAHEGEIFRNVSGEGWPRRLSVGSADLIGVIAPSHGISVVTPEGTTDLYADYAQHFWNNCSAEDLAILPSGIFMYAPGCNGPYVIKGTMDGAGIETMDPFDPVTHAAILPMCLARAPAGGFYAIVRDGANVPSRSLRYFGANFAEASGHWGVPTDPPLDAVDWQNTWDCAMAVAPTGTIFFAVGGDLWRIDP